MDEGGPAKTIKICVYFSRFVNNLNKSCLQCKQELFTMLTRVVYNVNKSCLQCKQELFPM